MYSNEGDVRLVGLTPVQPNACKSTGQSAMAVWWLAGTQLHTGPGMGPLAFVRMAF